MRTMQRLLLDSVILSVFVLLVNPAATGIAFHEWASVAVIVPVVVHLAVKRRWVVRTTRRFFAMTATAPRLNLVVDAALLGAAAIAMVSGLAISRAVLPALGITLAASTVWTAVHSGSAYATLALVAAHTALHWRWIEQALGLYEPEALRAYQTIPAHVAVEDRRSER